MLRQQINEYAQIHTERVSGGILGPEAFKMPTVLSQQTRVESDVVSDLTPLISCEQNVVYLMKAKILKKEKWKPENSR